MTRVGSSLRTKLASGPSGPDRARWLFWFRFLRLIFDPQLGILANWRDLDAARQMEEVGLAWVVLKGGVTGGEG